MTIEQNVSFIEVLSRLPYPKSLSEGMGLWLEPHLYLQYDDFDVTINTAGNVYLTARGSVKPVLIYDSFKRVFDISGIPISPIDKILKKVGRDV